MDSECKRGKIWPFRPRKMTFRAIQPNLSFDMWFISCQRSFIPKKKKSYWSVSEIDPSPLNLDGQTDRQTDDGQLGIRKAPLPDGTAELKNITILSNAHKSMCICVVDKEYCQNMTNIVAHGNLMHFCHFPKVTKYALKFDKLLDIQQLHVLWSR